MRLTPTRWGGQPRRWQMPAGKSWRTLRSPCATGCRPGALTKRAGVRSRLPQPSRVTPRLGRPQSLSKPAGQRSTTRARRTSPRRTTSSPREPWLKRGTTRSAHPCVRRRLQRLTMGTSSHLLAASYVTSALLRRRRCTPAARHCKPTVRGCTVTWHRADGIFEAHRALFAASGSLTEGQPFTTLATPLPSAVTLLLPATTRA
mmetsp:Transcript_41458/g.119955  ORF Transcript_41458/g.119955 Transcript_41458/m.119955 type:complete len:203 (-) Transcript_41458:504-1112(-)